ncbi:hypothetical protein [Legionella brunensis]|uniref:hypothetical protein n=1 Tax=Legionella brunensis TaxID=29422 RepID=UPI0010412F21|nr:hypothetical protein [Legionella brunensis]
MRFIWGSLFYGLVSLAWADASPSTWFTQEANNQVKIQVSLFLSTTCPHCHKADAFFRDLEDNTSWIEVHRYFINKDKAALTTFNQFLEQQNADDFNVPSIFFCNSRWVGFAEAETSGKTLLRGLTYCRNQITKTGQLSAATTRVLRQWATATWYGNMASESSVVPFIFMLAITDVLNPCSLFCIFTLFAFLLVCEKRSLQLTLGLLFLIVMGLVHYVQQVHSVFFFQYYNNLRIPLILIGLALLAYVLGYFKILNDKKPYAFLTLVGLSALGLQAYTQTCTPNLALIFEQWLLAQQFSPLKIRILEVTYQVLYLVFMLLFVLIIIFVSKLARFAKYRTISTKIATIFLCIVALFFILYPQGLAKLWISFLSFIVSIIIAFLVRKRTW